jgi:hypothetical protein
VAVGEFKTPKHPQTDRYLLQAMENIKYFIWAIAAGKVVEKIFVTWERRKVRQ